MLDGKAGAARAPAQMQPGAVAGTPPEGAAPVPDLAAQAEEVAALLRLIANGRRLLILCHLAEAGEATAGTLSQAAGLSQPATSQHLTRLREEGLILFRRDRQTLWYRIADPRVPPLLATLRDLFCTAHA